MPETWRELAGKPRKGSAASKVLDSLLAQPVFSADDAVDRLGGSPSSVYAAINRLHDSGVIRPLTKRTRNQVWVASALADELDDLGVRIETRARKEKP
jgi:transcription initiation factor IIE alpha subunit